MIRRAIILAALGAAGCAGSAHPSVDLEAEVRQLRQAQQDQARRIELLENRVVIAEDTARLARDALTGARGRNTVRIGADASDAPSGEVREPGADAPPSDDDGSAPGPDDDTGGPRPVVRAVGREAPSPTAAQPIVVHSDDRLPVVPVPPPPATQPAQPSGGSPRRQGPASNVPHSEAAVTDPLPVASAAPGAPVPGVSSVRDPRAAPAYDRAVALARGGQCAQAVDAFSEFLVRWPDHPFADNAMYWRGECIFSGGDVRRAAGEFEGLIARFPVGNKVPDALYKLVVCYRRLGDAARAEGFARQLLRDYPQSEVAARLRGGG